MPSCCSLSSFSGSAIGNRRVLATLLPALALGLVLAATIGCSPREEDSRERDGVNRVFADVRGIT